jgi:hypothetical protein
MARALASRLQSSRAIAMFLPPSSKAIGT